MFPELNGAETPRRNLPLSAAAVHLRPAGFGREAGPGRNMGTLSEDMFRSRRAPDAGGADEETGSVRARESGARTARYSALMSSLSARMAF